ncbi:MAG TPA: MmcQ/YjbR family DNA-binding protein [Longimicrobium sp.]|nr:MmcQ/YjbR family DNA-binding protein [Longimicrobium sp.]
MMTDHVERVRRAALALPEATEQEAWGEPTWRVKKKVFAMYASAKNHHGAGHESLWCAAPLGVQEILVRNEPEKFFVPPYVGPKGWLGIRLDAVDGEELRQLLVQSYCVVAPRKLQALVEE